MILCAGELPPGSTLIDPMCGAGTLITEAAMHSRNTVVVGVDIDTTQLEKAQENINFAGCNENVELLHADVTHLPLKDACVNAVICDLPFGNKFGTPEGVKQLLPLALMEMNRILTIKGKIVLLINEALKKCLFDSLLIPEMNNSCTSRLNEISNISSEHKPTDQQDSSKSESEEGLSSKLIGNSLLIKPQSQNSIIQWKNEENYVVKLGEMVASICVFEKQD
ncbi:hypothetical protein C0J52_01734 [Blattella germanica]|nr:hypothetical protein C0J52_01734 [Blattella germanica]